MGNNDWPMTSIEFWAEAALCALFYLSESSLQEGQ